MTTCALRLVLVRRERDALLVRRITADLTPFWLPSSQVSLSEQVDREFTMAMPEWLAKSKGLLVTAGDDQLRLI